MYRDIVLPSWEGYNYNVSIYEAITPATMDDSLQFDLKRTRENAIRGEFTPTEKAVWHSHFNLWNMCMESDEPMLIIEHDSMLMKPLPKLTGSCTLSYVEDHENKHRRKRQSTDWMSGKFCAPGSGYYITPSCAKRLIQFTYSMLIRSNVDGYINSVINYAGTPRQRKMKTEDISYIKQINYGPTTIDHG